ncbi:MAG: helix-turn-helix transcriptional regulator [Clostridia bacterium]
MKYNYSNDEVNKKVGERVKHYRKIRGITQEKLAEVIDKSTNYVGMFERGATGITIETLIKISNFLNVTPNNILQDYIPVYEEDETADFLYNQFTTMNDKDKRLLLTISNHIIAENK